MDKFTDILAAITDEKNRDVATQLLEKILADFPTLETTVKWKQAMFTEHGTFILAFNFSKQHFSVAPEKAAIAHFTDRLAQTDYVYTDNIIKIAWTQPLDYSLVADLITYNLAEKKDYTKFWRE